MHPIDWRTVIVGSMMGVALVGCSSAPRSPSTAAPAHSSDPDARAFTGNIVSLRYPTSTMLISKDERRGRDQFPNIVTVRYDANTQFLLDGQPTTLDKIEQYMTVSVDGRMRDGQLFADKANFSSALPVNVRRAEAR
jgi:hypothetical protein